MFETYELPQGKIVFSHITKELSTGILALDPHRELPKHNRTVIEQLVQIVGTCVMQLFDGNMLVQEVVLRESDTFTIPANQFHMHKNTTSEASVTMWKFEGDILEVIQNIRDGNEQIK